MDLDQFVSDLKQTFQQNVDAGFIGQRFSGLVDGIEIHADRGFMIFDVQNGGRFVSCAVPMDDDAKNRDDLPLQGDSVSGILNQAASTVNVGHRTVMAVLDFENISAGERKRYADWMRRQP